MQDITATGRRVPGIVRVTRMLRRLRDAESAEEFRARLSRVEPLSAAEARRIPDGDFVSASFDTKAAQRPSRMVVLLTTPRSGSTYLCELLHRTGFCTTHEYFQHEHYLPLLAHRWGCVDRDRLCWSRYARALERHRTSANGVLGIKLHGRHLRRFVEALPHFSAPKVEYVCLRRRDKLRQAISFAIAMQTQQWSSLFRARAEARYDYAKIRKCLSKIHAEEDLIAAYLHAGAVPHETVYYEDLVEDPRGVLRLALGVDIGEIARDGTAVQPQGGKANDVWVSALGQEIFFGRGVEGKAVPSLPAIARGRLGREGGADVKIFGERNCATTALAELIERNSRSRVLPSVARDLDPKFDTIMRMLAGLPFGSHLQERYVDGVFWDQPPRLSWKHAATTFTDVASFRDCVVVFLVRHPASWLVALKRRPYHAPRRVPESLSEFIASEWRTAGRENLDRRILPPIELWNTKIRSYVAFSRRLSQAGIAYRWVRFEDFVCDQSSVFTALRDVLRSPAGAVSIVTKSTKERSKDFRYYRDYYGTAQWLNAIDDTSRALIDESVDWDLAASFGYRRLAELAPQPGRSRVQPSAQGLVL